MTLDGNPNWPFRSIVVGFDNSAHGRDGLALARLLAGACQARLTAACAVRHAECPLLLLPRGALAREANRGKPARDMAARLA
jgi:hypothetical protein